MRPQRQPGSRPRAMSRSLLVDPDLAAATRLIAQAGLFEKRPAFYGRKFAEVAVLLAVVLAAMANFDSLAVRLAAAVLLALTFTQIAYLGHDAGHHQIFRQRRHNDWFGVVIVNLFIGLSYEWWVEKHTQHHDHANDLDHDPDIQFPLMVFDPQQLARPRSAVQIFCIRHQALLFFPLLTLLPYSMKWDSAQHVARPGARFRRAEIVLLLAHGLLLTWAAIGLLGVAHGVAFLLVNQAAFGVLLGSAFAANHKGMPMLQALEEKSYFRQRVATARNLRAHPLTGYLYGGLDCQIEHHLFPMLPRHNLRRAAPLVRKYCAERGVTYYETGMVEAYAEIFQHLHAVSAPLRVAPLKKPSCRPIRDDIFSWTMARGRGRASKWSRPT
ncbi:MAG: acyl-CoA desaturase [Opitutus sp.]|nr:acyl-CoA desaturase [Opitutus sp.]